jgi:hypothetical protein
VRRARIVIFGPSIVVSWMLACGGNVAPSDNEIVLRPPPLPPPTFVAPPPPPDPGEPDPGAQGPCPQATSIDAASLPWEPPAPVRIGQCAEQDLVAMVAAIKAAR